MLVFACPGQGSQSQGFLSPWFAAKPELRQRLAQLSKACGKDLIQLGTESDEETIRRTENAQPLIVGSAIAIYREFFEGRAEAVVGHSVGEFAAAAIAGIISDDDAMRLVSIRATAMQRAAESEATSMAAVIGGEEPEVLKSIEAAGIFAANYNGAGQIVAAGGRAGIDQLVSNPPERARVIELKVAGAFHTHYMASAVQELAEAAASVEVSDPRFPIWTNFDGGQITSGLEFLNLMVSQTANSVRWDRCMDQLQNASAKVVELPPAGALSGLVKRGAPAASALALKSPDDVLKVAEL